VQRKKPKIRIGEKQSDEDDDDMLNNDQSRQYQEYMEQKYAPPSQIQAAPSQTQQDIKLTSNFGKQYMK
jgi:hypothetical protein